MTNQSTILQDLARSPLHNHLADVIAVDVVLMGHSGARVYRLFDAHNIARFLKIGPLHGASSIRDEVERLRWLAGRLPVPNVLAYAEAEEFEGNDGDRDDNAGLGYLLMSAVAGRDCAELMDEALATSSAPGHDERMARLARLLGEGLRQVHRVPWQDCPFDHTLAFTLEMARQRTEGGLIDVDDFDEERQGQSAASLFEELWQSVPQEEELCFTHGDYCLPNLLIASNSLSGFIDVGRAGVSDRYRDLALARRSLCYNGGEKYVPQMFEAYGSSNADGAIGDTIVLDEEKLRFYQLLDEFF